MSESSPNSCSKAAQALGILEKLPLTERAQAIREAKRDLYLRSLFCTCKFLLGFADMNAATHSKMIQALESDSRRKLIVMPRGTFKSTIASVGYPIWQLARRPNLRILLDSELYSNSKNFLRVIKGLVAQASFIELFGDWRGDVWNEGEIVIAPRSATGMKEASITCSGIGAQKTGQHYDLIIADDLNSPRNSNTPEGLEKVVNHYRLYTSLLEPNGTIVIVGTRYASGDVIGSVLRNELGIDDAQIGKTFV